MRYKNIVINTLLVLASVGAVFLAVELGLRATVYKSLLEYQGIPAHYYQPDRENGYDIAPNFPISTHEFADSSYDIWSNELGCFDDPYQGEKPYILLLGDSLTWGYTPFEQKWGTVLEQIIDTRILKCAVSGYGTRQQLTKTQRLLDILQKPELILVGYYENDIQDDADVFNRLVYEGRLIKNFYRGSGYTYDELMEMLPEIAWRGRVYCMWNEPKHPLLQRTKCFLSQHSISYNLTKDVIKQNMPVAFLQQIGLVNVQPSAWVKEDTREHYATVRAFQALAEKYDTSLVFVLIPSRDSVANGADPYADIKQVFDDSEIAYIDLLPSFAAASSDEALYWPNDRHLNPEGNGLIGRTVAQELAQDHVRSEDDMVRAGETSSIETSPDVK